MANTLGELLISLGLDTTQLDKGAKDALAKTKKMNQQFTRGQVDVSRQAGRAGAQAGKNFVQAYNKELTFLGGVLRFAGFGRGAELLELSRQYGESRFASSVAGEAIGQSVGKTISRESVAKGVEKSMAGEVIGNALGEAIGKEAHTRYRDFTVDLHKAIKFDKTFAEDFARMAQAKAGITIPFGETGTRGKIGKVGLLSGLLRTPGLALGSGVGIGAASALGGIGVVSALGALGNRVRTKDIEKLVSAQTITAIDSIKDPVERFNRVMAEFGAGGEKKLRELREETEKFKKSLDANAELRQLGDSWGMTWNSMKEVAGKVVDGTLWLLNKVAAGFNYVHDLMGAGVDKELMKDIRESAALVEASEKKLEEKQKQRVKDKEQISKLDEVIAQKEFDALESNEEKLDILEKQKTTLQWILDNTNTGDVKHKQAQVELLDILRNIQSVEASITTEKDKQKQQQQQLLNAQKAYRDSINDANTAYEDRSKFGLDELAGMEGVNVPRARNLQELQHLRLLMSSNPGFRQQMAEAERMNFNIRAAREIQNAESWAKQARLTGNEFGARQATEYALRLRQQLGILNSSDRAPMKAYLDRMNTSMATLAEMARNEGLRVQPVMGK